MLNKVVIAFSLLCAGMLHARTTSTQETSTSPKRSWWFLKNTHTAPIDVEITPHSNATSGTLTAGPAAGGNGIYNTRKATKSVIISDIEPNHMAVMTLLPNADAMYFMNVSVTKAGTETILAEKGIKVQPGQSYHVALNVGKNIKTMNYDDLVQIMIDTGLQTPTQEDAPRKNHNNKVSVEKVG